jgi:hypothetical protein
MFMDKSTKQGKIFKRNKKKIINKNKKSNSLFDLFKSNLSFNLKEGFFESANREHQVIIDQENEEISDLNLEFEDTLGTYSENYEDYLNYLSTGENDGVDMDALELKIVALNEKLKNIINTIKNKTINRKNKRESVETTTLSKREQLLDKIVELNGEKEKYKKEVDKRAALSGEYENILLNADSIGFQHTVWAMCAIGLSIGIYRTFLRD